MKKYLLAALFCLFSIPALAGVGHKIYPATDFSGTNLLTQSTIGGVNNLLGSTNLVNSVTSTNRVSIQNGAANNLTVTNSLTFRNTNFVITSFTGPVTPADFGFGVSTYTNTTTPGLYEFGGFGSGAYFGYYNVGTNGWVFTNTGSFYVYTTNTPTFPVNGLNYNVYTNGAPYISPGGFTNFATFTVTNPAVIVSSDVNSNLNIGGGAVLNSPTSAVTLTSDANTNLNVSSGVVLNGTFFAAALIPTMTSSNAPSGVASADSENGVGFEAWRAMDGLPSTYWQGHTSASGFTNWIQYQFPVAIAAKSYLAAFVTNSATDPNYPSAWILQASQNGSAWVNLDSETGGNSGGRFNFLNSTPYVYYRLNLGVNDEVSFAVSTFQVFGNQNGVTLSANPNSNLNVLGDTNLSELHVNSGASFNGNVSTPFAVLPASIVSGDINSTGNIDASTYTSGGSPIQYLTNTLISIQVSGAIPLYNQTYYFFSNTIPTIAGPFPAGYWTNATTPTSIFFGGGLGIMVTNSTTLFVSNILQNSFYQGIVGTNTYIKRGNSVLGIYTPYIFPSAIGNPLVTALQTTNSAQGITSLIGTGAVTPSMSGGVGNIPTNSYFSQISGTATNANILSSTNFASQFQAIGGLTNNQSGVIFTNSSIFATNIVFAGGMISSYGTPTNYTSAASPLRVYWNYVNGKPQYGILYTN